MARKRITRYSKERTRIVHSLYNLKKQGYITDLYFPTELELRKQGVKESELSKLTRNLKAITLKELKKLSNKIQNPIQEQTNTAGFEPPENLLEFGISNVIVQNFKSQILYFPKEISDKIIALINTLVLEQGVDDVAYALQNMPMQFYEYINRKGYDSNSSIQEFSSALIEYLPNASDAYKADIMDAFEYNELGYTIES